MASPQQDPSFYAPPRTETPSAPAAPPLSGQSSPGLVGFLAVVGCSAVSAFLAFIAMVVWHENVPISSGFLAGLGEAIVAVLSWAALWAFATVSSVVLAVAVLGHRGRAPAGAWLFIGILAACAAVVCFLPVKGKDPDLFRGAMGLCTEAICMVVAHFAMLHARRTYLAAAPVPSSWSKESEGSGSAAVRGNEDPGGSD